MKKADVIRQIDLLSRCAVHAMPYQKGRNLGYLDGLQFAAANLAEAVGIASYASLNRGQLKEAA